MAVAALSTHPRDNGPRCARACAQKSSRGRPPAAAGSRRGRERTRAHHKRTAQALSPTPAGPHTLLSRPLPPPPPRNPGSPECRQVLAGHLADQRGVVPKVDGVRKPAKVDVHLVLGGALVCGGAGGAVGGDGGRRVRTREETGREGAAPRAPLAVPTLCRASRYRPCALAPRGRGEERDGLRGGGRAGRAPL